MKNLIFAMVISMVAFGCRVEEPVSTSGVTKTTVTVKKDANGKTVEQNNIIARMNMDNNPGSIKHLYIISSYSGDVILYSTVKNKVTSSGKRLSPYSVSGTYGKAGYYEADIPVRIGDNTYATPEVLQDDGTYGHSIEYLYWFDARNNYHQHYVSGGQIVHVSDVPMRWPKIILNLETNR